ncbi:MAG: thioredoxin [Planctomycetaceae bacterium]|nr:MAG: thioredoxin [Planctomycetaceae bacterium]
MASENVIEITDGNFEQEVNQAGKPALVDFWAEWCMPCKMLAPTIDEIANEYAGRLVVGKVDTDNNREVSMKFGISAIPTVILFKDGAVVKKFVGLQGKKELKAAIDSVL